MQYLLGCVLNVLDQDRTDVQYIQNMCAKVLQYNAK